MSGKGCQDFIREAFDTNWVVPLGPNVNAFEEELKHFVGQNKEVVALSAGTAAIHLGLIQLGVSTGDEVICQSFTFCASTNPVAYQGATPVFIDSEEDTWNMDPALLEEAYKRPELRKQVKSLKPFFRFIFMVCLPELMRFVLLHRNMTFRCWKMLPKL